MTSSNFNIAPDFTCRGCTYIRFPQGGWCYMFRDKPEGVCAQHTNNQSTRLGHGVVHQRDTADLTQNRDAVSEQSRVEITIGAWRGERGYVKEQIPANGAFRIALDSGLQVAFHDNEFKAVGHVP